MKTMAGWAVASALLLGVSMNPARAEEVEKKFRIGGSLGGANTRASVESDSANTLLVFDSSTNLVDIVRDPRGDSGAFASFGLEPAWRASVSGQYAFTRHLILEASIGYQRGEVGDVIVQAQFPDQEIPQNQRFGFRSYDFSAGDIEQIPLDVTALFRFRPKTSFNPYLGGGLGYRWVGFSPSSKLDAASVNLSRSRGGIAPLASSSGIQTINPPLSQSELSGATVSAPDTWVYNAAAGFEIQFKKHWTVFADLKWSFAQREFSLRFNGADSFGLPVPEGAIFEGTQIEAGPMLISEGGLLDTGRRATIIDVGTNQPVTVFVFEPDGVPDPGYYYVQAGTVSYDGPTLQFGVRYTF